MGRHTSYLEEFCETVVELGRLGKSKAQMAAAIGVTRNTLDNWAKEFPEFLGAIAHARELSMAWWEDIGQARLVEHHQGPKLNHQLWSRSMAARFPDDYREKTETTHQAGQSLIDMVTGSYTEPKE